MNIKYCVPSYNRPGGVTILGYLKQAKVYVSPQDYPRYIQCNPQYVDNIVELPDGVQGKGKAHVMNWLLDNLWDKETDAIIFLDDDIRQVMAHGLDCHDVKKTEDEFYEICENNTLLAKEWGCGLWGFSPNRDRLGYYEWAPFRLHAYIDGWIQGIVKDDGLRYDEELTVKEDVDFFLQQLHKYHKALRVEKYYLRKRSFEGDGGSQEFRKEGVEKEQFKMMQKKWGPDVIRPNKPKSSKKDGIRAQGGAIRLNIPFEGV